MMLLSRIAATVALLCLLVGGFCFLTAMECKNTATQKRLEAVSAVCASIFIGFLFAGALAVIWR